MTRRRPVWIAALRRLLREGIDPACCRVRRTSGRRRRSSLVDRAVSVASLAASVRRRAAARDRSHLATRARLATCLRGRAASRAQRRRVAASSRRAASARAMSVAAVFAAAVSAAGAGTSATGSVRAAAGAAAERRQAQVRALPARRLPPRRCRSRAGRLRSRPEARWRREHVRAGRGQQAGAERQRSPSRSGAGARTTVGLRPATTSSVVGSMPVGIACGKEATSAMSVRGGGGASRPEISTPVFSAIVANSVRSSSGVYGLSRSFTWLSSTRVLCRR